MIASTTQEAPLNEHNSTPRRSPIEKILFRSPSKIGPKEFNEYIQQEYGACWGTLKFEDYYSNEVKFALFSLAMKLRLFGRLDHFFTLMVALISIL